MDKLNRIYITEVFRSISHSSLSIFLPIFLLKTGLNVLELSFFYIVMFSSSIIISLLSLLFFMKKGNLLMVTSLFMRGVFYYSLYAFLNWHILAIAFGLAIGLYWSVVDLALIYLPKKRWGLKIGILYSLMNTASMLGPIIGGAVVSYLGYTELFLTALFLLIPAVASALLIGDFGWQFKKIDSSFLINYFKSRAGIILLLVTPIYGVISVPGWIYQPLLLNQYAGSEFNMGIIQTLINLLVSISYLAAGKLFDLNKARSILILALFIEGVSMVTIGFSQSIEVYTAGSWLASFGAALIAAPFWGVISRTAFKENYNAIIFFTIIALGGSRIISLALLAPLLASGDIQTIFVILAVVIWAGTVLALFIPKHFFDNRNHSE